MAHASKKIAPRRALLSPLVISLMAVVVLRGTSFAESEIDAYDRAVSLQSEDYAIFFLEKFRSGHLVGDSIESLHPDVARKVCASLRSGGSETVRRACSRLAQAVPTEGTGAQNGVPAGLPAGAAAKPTTDEEIMKSGIGEAPEPDATSSVSLGFVASSTTPVLVADAAPAIPAQTAAMPGFRVQLWSTKSGPETREGWRQLQAAYPDFPWGSPACCRYRNLIRHELSCEVPNRVIIPPHAGDAQTAVILAGIAGELTTPARSRESVLRHQLNILRRRAWRCLRLSNADRLAFVWPYRLCPVALDGVAIIRQEPLIGWHRRGFKVFWRWKFAFQRLPAGDRHGDPRPDPGDEPN